MKRLQTIATLVATGALLAVPTVGQAHHKPGHERAGNGGGSGKSCTKRPTVKKAFVVRGTLVSYTAGDAGSVTVDPTRANRHARVSGELSGSSYTVDHVNPTDPFSVRLAGYEAGETPGAGDRVRIVGKVTVTRKRCADAGDTVADRYGAVDVRRVRIVDAD